MEKRKKYISLSLALVIVTIMASCASLATYGRIQPLSARGAVTIEDLTGNWNEYHVSYAGLSPGSVQAIAFDPKGDEMVVTGKRWNDVENEIILEKLIHWIRFPDNAPPKVYRILGPDNEFYGFMYTGRRYPVMKRQDDRTLYLYDLKRPETYSEGFGRNR